MSHQLAPTIIVGNYDLNFQEARIRLIYCDQTYYIDLDVIPYQIIKWYDIEYPHNIAEYLAKIDTSGENFTIDNLIINGNFEDFIKFFGQDLCITIIRYYEKPVKHKITMKDNREIDDELRDFINNIPTKFHSPYNTFNVCIRLDIGIYIDEISIDDYIIGITDSKMYVYGGEIEPEIINVLLKHIVELEELSKLNNIMLVANINTTDKFVRIMSNVLKDFYKTWPNVYLSIDVIILELYSNLITTMNKSANMKKF